MPQWGTFEHGLLDEKSIPQILKVQQLQKYRYKQQNYNVEDIQEMVDAIEAVAVVIELNKHIHYEDILETYANEHS